MYQTFFRRGRNDASSSCVFLRQLFMKTEKVGEPSHHAELRLLERLHVRPGVNAISQKAEKILTSFSLFFLFFSFIILTLSLYYCLSVSWLCLCLCVCLYLNYLSLCLSLSFFLCLFQSLMKLLFLSCLT